MTASKTFCRTAAGLLILLWLASFFSPGTAAPTAPHVRVSGDVKQVLEVAFSDLESMPREKVTARDHEGKNGMFTGVTLWDIINRAEPRLGAKRNNTIANAFIVVSAADNYQCVFALAELEPSFTDSKIILAYERDGGLIPPPQGPFQIIVRGDKSHARWVRQVTGLEVVIRSGKAAAH